MRPVQGCDECREYAAEERRQHDLMDNLALDEVRAEWREHLKAHDKVEGKNAHEV